jgi:hypothetical protein
MQFALLLRHWLAPVRNYASERPSEGGTFSTSLTTRDNLDVLQSLNAPA